MIAPELLKEIESDELNANRVVEILELASRYWINGDRSVQDDVEIVVRLLDRLPIYEEHLKGSKAVIHALARQAGLFPYFERSGDLNDDIAYEAHRAPGLNAVYFHSGQMEVYSLLSSGKNVILSAPTSFGKTLLVDALIASRSPASVIMVVPTIALLEERRRRLTSLFPHYQIVTQAYQEIVSPKYIVLGTQERILERNDLSDPDLFVIDEFYKLDLTGGDMRAKSLNLLLARYIDSAKQIYLLGPSIDTNPVDTEVRPDVTFVSTVYSPVAANIIHVEPPGTDPETLFQVLASLKHTASLVYCRSPKSARKAAVELTARGYHVGSTILSQIATWLRENYHQDWYLAEALHNGIGIHHGRVPRAVASLMVQLLNNNAINTLLCTSSLIEGVNTVAKNILIYDKFISNKKLDRFTFNNIKGRAGRMFRHYIGNVFLFNPDTPTASEQLDIPLLKNSDAITDQSLVQLPDASLSERNRTRKQKILQGTPVPEAILKRFGKYGISELERVYESITELKQSDDKRLLWNGLGSYREVFSVIDLVWGVLEFNKHDVHSSRQFAFLATKLCRATSIANFLSAATSGGDGFGDTDTQIDKAFSFLRGAEFSFAEPIQVVQEMVNDIYGDKVCDYSKFVGDLSSWGLPGRLKALEEQGVPAPIVSRLKDYLIPEDVDASFEIIRTLLREGSVLTEAERIILGFTLESAD